MQTFREWAFGHLLPPAPTVEQIADQITEAARERSEHLSPHLMLQQPREGT